MREIRKVLHRENLNQLTLQLLNFESLLRASNKRIDVTGAVSNLSDQAYIFSWIIRPYVASKYGVQR